MKQTILSFLSTDGPFLKGRGDMNNYAIPTKRTAELVEKTFRDMYYEDMANGLHELENLNGQPKPR